ncbi:MAG: 5,6-dimethylbenzimidazole synthase [Shimia sp.]|nr:5,6-dimethylbenzimidazole synthase [Shimia sp.]
MSDFSQDFRSDLTRLMRWRRDVRRFRTDPVDEALLTECLSSFSLAPSVGLSEPWRVLRVQSDAARAAALSNYETANAEALATYSDDRAAIYARLKLSGMREAPVQLAVYCDDATSKGAGLGAATMPEMRRYSVVGAITQFWLTARGHGLGVGWVSILDPVQLNADLDVPQDWSLVAYLCVGWPEELSETPELITVGWEDREEGLPVQTR